MQPRRRPLVALALAAALGLALVVPGSAATAVAAPEAPFLSVGVERGAITIARVDAVCCTVYRVFRAVGSGPETEVAHDVTMPWTDTDLTPGVRYSYRARAVFGGVQSDFSAPAQTVMALAPADGHDGEFTPIDPFRALDTRIGLGAPVGPVGPGGVVSFDPRLTDALPGDGVSAVLLNVTGTESTQPTHVRVWPTGEPLPDTSSLNLVPGTSRPNQVVVPLGADGTVSLHNNAGSTQLIADVQGFYSTADGVDGVGYYAGPSLRLFDTRLPERGLQHAADGDSPLGEGPLGPFTEVWIPLYALMSVPVTAVEVNVTATEPTQPGHLVAWPGQSPAPGVSNVNFVPGQTVPNRAVVPVTFNAMGWPGIALKNNSGGRTHVIIDLQGFYDDGSLPAGLRYRPTDTRRIADTRVGNHPLAPGQTLVVPRPTEQEEAAVAHVVNVTATQSTGPGHLIGWSGDGVVPGTSVVNFARGEDSPNLATVTAGADGRIAVTGGSSTVHVVVDHLGYFY